MPPIAVDQFHPRSSGHHPRTLARVVHEPRRLLVRFDVDDRFVRSVATRYQDSVCLDSCVEFFVQPKDGMGYFNFEVNCGGTLLLHYVEDPTRTPQGFAKCTPVTPDLGRQITIAHSMPAVVDPEQPGPLHWSITYPIPLAVMEAYVGAIGPLPGQTWRANFYKCADQTSHPHWGSWSPIGNDLNFHQPGYFGELRFV